MKESEWIVNPKQLKLNHKQAMIREEIKKDERKLTILKIAIGIILVIMLIQSVAFIKNSNNDFMRKCTNAGNSVEFCRANL